MNNPQILEVLSALGVQMSDVAPKAGMTYEELSRYATTRFDVPDEAIEKIAKVLGVDASAFSGDGYKSLCKNCK